MLLSRVQKRLRKGSGTLPDCSRITSFPGGRCLYRAGPRGRALAQLVHPGRSVVDDLGELVARQVPETLLDNLTSTLAPKDEKQIAEDDRSNAEDSRESQED